MEKGWYFTRDTPPVAMPETTQPRELGPIIPHTHSPIDLGCSQQCNPAQLLGCKRCMLIPAPQGGSTNGGMLIPAQKAQPHKGASQMGDAYPCSAKVTIGCEVTACRAKLCLEWRESVWQAWHLPNPLVISTLPQMGGMEVRGGFGRNAHSYISHILVNSLRLSLSCTELCMLKLLFLIGAWFYYACSGCSCESYCHALWRWVLSTSFKLSFKGHIFTCQNKVPVRCIH